MYMLSSPEEGLKGDVRAGKTGKAGKAVSSKHRLI